MAKQHSVQVRDADYQRLKKMAKEYPRVRMNIQGEAERTGTVGVKHTEMIGHCIALAWNALQELQGSQDTDPIRRSP